MMKKSKKKKRRVMIKIEKDKKARVMIELRLARQGSLGNLVKDLEEIVNVIFGRLVAKTQEIQATQMNEEH